MFHSKFLAPLPRPQNKQTNPSVLNVVAVCWRAAVHVHPPPHAVDRAEQILQERVQRLESEALASEKQASSMSEKQRFEGDIMMPSLK